MFITGLVGRFLFFVFHMLYPALIFSKYCWTCMSRILVAAGAQPRYMTVVGIVMMMTSETGIMMLQLLLIT